MLERTGSELTLSKQADLLSMSRSSLYYMPRAPSVYLAVKALQAALYATRQTT